MSVPIYRYVVRFDAGSAPRPFGGVCTLAICKPRIRLTALVGSWILGFRGKQPDQVIYAMQVSERVSFADYWLDPRFRDRRPGASPVPDNIYRPAAAGRLQQVPNPVHDEDHYGTDVGGAYVLIGSRYWYFGANSPTLPTELIHLVPYPRGHSVHKNRRPNDVELLERWLAAWPSGLHGDPIDASPALTAWLATHSQQPELDNGRPRRTCPGPRVEQAGGMHQARKPSCR